MSRNSPLHKNPLKETTFERRDGLALEIEVLDLQQLLKPPYSRETVTPTRTHFHALLMISGGPSSHYIDFNRHEITAGDLLVIPKGCVQSFDKDRAARGHMVLFTSNFLTQCQVDIHGLTECCEMLLNTSLQLRLGQKPAKQLNRCIDMIKEHSTSTRETPYAKNSVASAFSLMMFTLAGFSETMAQISDVPQDELVAQFLVLLEHNYRTNHLGSFYAERLGVSLRTLDRRLNAALDLSSRQAISSRLLLEAKRLLTLNDIAIKEISYELGFSEPQNFTRFFRAQVAVSPLQFRQKLATREWDTYTGCASPADKL